MYNANNKLYKMSIKIYDIISLDVTFNQFWINQNTSKMRYKSAIERLRNKIREIYAILKKKKSIR